MRFRLNLVAACAVDLAVSASPHYSHGQYEETYSDVEGVVKELHLLVPHSWIDENGNGIRYQSMYRNGFPVPPRIR